MKTKDQVCSIEKSKMLKALGVAQISMLAYSNSKDNICVRTHGLVNDHGGCVSLPIDDSLLWTGEETYSAFTAAELGRLMPFTISHNGVDYELWTIKKHDGWLVRYMNERDVLRPLCSAFEDCQAEALASMLINIIQSGFTEWRAINKRLT